MDCDVTDAMYVRILDGNAINYCTTLILRLS